MAMARKKRKKRILRTAKPVHTRAQILVLEQKAIDEVHKAGFVDHGRTDWRRTYENGTEVHSNRKRYLLPGTPLRVTVGPQTIHIYRMVNDVPQIGENLKTIEVARDPKLLHYVIDLYRSGEL